MAPNQTFSQGLPCRGASPLLGDRDRRGTRPILGALEGACVVKVPPCWAWLASSCAVLGSDTIRPTVPKVLGLGKRSIGAASGPDFSGYPTRHGCIRMFMDAMQY